MSEKISHFVSMIFDRFYLGLYTCDFDIADSFKDTSLDPITNEYISIKSLLAVELHKMKVTTKKRYRNYKVEFVVHRFLHNSTSQSTKKMWI